MAAETRELVVTARIRMRYQDLLDNYAHAITTDGGYRGTLDEHIQDTAEDLIRDVEDILTGPVYDCSWEIVNGG